MVKMRISTALLAISGLLIIVVLLAMGGTPILAQADEVPRFDIVDCAEFEIPDSAEDVECGYLTVPEFHARPDGDTIQLAVLIIKSTSPDPAPDPLVLAQGGPGGSGIDLYKNLLNSGDAFGELGAKLRSDRDLIVFEQRGTHHSQPFLFCQEVFDATLNSLEENLSDEEEARLAIDAFDACKASLEQEGIDVSAYDSEENAHDIADLAAALGYDQINYYGVSYGTMLGQHLMRLHPEILRSVILDGIVAISGSPNQKIDAAKHRAYTELFAACAADPDCDETYPNLEQIFTETIDLLNQTPARVPITDPETGTTYNIFFSGDDFADIIVGLLYQTDMIPALPKLIYDARDGQFGLIGAALSMFIFDREMATGMYYSVMCAEDFDYTPDELDLTGVRESFVEDAKKEAETDLKICEIWDVERLGPEADQPIVSDIPTLLLSGNFDPVTPASNAEIVAETLSDDYAYVFSADGHGVFMKGECANSIVEQFLANPDQEPDASCLAVLGPPEFITPRNTFMAPALRRPMEALNELLSNPTDLNVLLAFLQKLILPFSILLGLFLFPLIWFGGWIINRLRKAPADKRLPARIAPWLVVLLDILIVFFIGRLGAYLATASLIDLYIGFDRAANTLTFIFPWLIAAVGIGIVVLAVMSWLKGYWGAVTRVYYSAIALLVTLTVLLVISSGLLTVLFS
jgi:pimeloyl-ACP methyl ester carboxylesterase